MPLHFFDMLIVALIGLALFGPKALQSVARSAGKGVGQAKEMKDKLLNELPVDEISKVTNSLPAVPLNSRQAIQMLISTDSSSKKNHEEKASLSNETKVEKGTAAQEK